MEVKELEYLKEEVERELDWILKKKEFLREKEADARNQLQKICSLIVEAENVD